MNETAERLRLKFESETDLIISEESNDWEDYALWLEHICTEEIKNNTIKENNILRNIIQETINALEQVLTSRITD